MCTSTKDSEIVDMINKLVGFKLKTYVLMPRGSKLQNSTLDVVTGNVIQGKIEVSVFQVTRIDSNTLNYVSGKVNQFTVSVECLYHFMLCFMFILFFAGFVFFSPFLPSIRRIGVSAFFQIVFVSPSLVV